PYYIGSLRFKTRTGKDPFETRTRSQIDEISFPGLQLELPRGSGFYGIQPALTVLLPSDPAVLFGTVSYLHSIKRDDVVQLTDGEPIPLGTVKPGGVFGFNFGMGLALNEKSSFSIGYDHATIGKTRVGGVPAVDAVRVQLGTLLLGYSYRVDAKQTVNVSLGVGATRDTPDVTLTVRVPMTF
ncbi:MAG TPA: acetate kinase, partial [Albitalea sp.]